LFKASDQFVPLWLAGSARGHRVGLRKELDGQLRYP